MRETPGEIRQLQWGIIPGEPSFSVRVGGKAAKDNKVSQIVENREMFLEYGYFEYNIYASEDGSTRNQFFWKRYTLRPHQIEYFFPGGEEQSLVV